MKKTLLFFITLIVCSCNDNKKTESTKSSQNQSANDTKSLNWLVGNWKRLNEKEGKETFENWKQLSPNEYSGIGYTMQKGDTISQETMHLVKYHSNWVLFVKTPDEKQAIEFKMTELNNHQFICINDSISFPKRIEYKIEGQNLKAKISNAEMEIPFEFEKK